MEALNPMRWRSHLLNTRGVRFLGLTWPVSLIPLLSVITIAQLGTASVIAIAQSEKTRSNGMEIVFTEELTGRMLKKGAITASFSNYRSRDGIFLRRSIEDYESDSKASNEFKSLLAKAKTIIEEGKKVGRDGKQSLDRAVVRWRRPERSDMTLAIIWRDGRRMYILESSSLSHLRSFETQVYP